jgi:hypothetical protein
MGHMTGQPFAGAGIFPQRLPTFSFRLQIAAKTFDGIIFFGHNAAVNLSRICPHNGGR